MLRTSIDTNYKSYKIIIANCSNYHNLSPLPRVSCGMWIWGWTATSTTVEDPSRTAIWGLLGGCAAWLSWPIPTRGLELRRVPSQQDLSPE